MRFSFWVFEARPSLALHSPPLLQNNQAFLAQQFRVLKPHYQSPRPYGNQVFSCPLLKSPFGLLISVLNLRYFASGFIYDVV